MKAFKKGDRVQWTAGGRGGTHIITGEVVGIVKPGELPIGRGHKFPKNVGARPHKSYLVKNSKGAILWPRVSALKEEGEVS